MDWEKLLTVFAAALGAFAGGAGASWLFACIKKCGRKKRTRQRIRFIEKEIERGIDRCKNFKDKLENGAYSLGIISTAAWNSLESIDELSAILDFQTVDKMTIIYELFELVNFNARLDRPGGATGYSIFALRDKNIEQLFEDIRPTLIEKSK